MQHLVQEKQVFNSIDAYISGSIDEGLFHITGKPAPGVTLEAAEAAVWQELKALTEESVDEDELEKVKNRYESEQIWNAIKSASTGTFRSTAVGVPPFAGVLPAVSGGLRCGAG